MMIYLKRCRYSIAALLISILITFTAGGNVLALTPTIASITPDSGWNNSETEVIINGSNFEEGAEVSIASILSSVDLPYTRNVYISDSYAYVAAGGLYVIDISTPKYPSILGFVDSPNFYSRGVYVSGNYAYVVGNITTSPKPVEGVCLKVIDISDPANPSEVASLEIADYSESKSIYVSGTYAYITYIRVGLAGSYGNLVVIDISDPTAPHTVGGWGGVPPGMGSPMDVYISGNYAYLAIAASDFMGTPLDPGLQVIDISDPTNPFLIKFFYMEISSTGVFVAGNNAYVTNGSGLQVIDISDPANPFIIGSVDTPGYAYGVYVSGNYAYVADGDSGLQVVNISNPLNPFIVASIDTPGRALAVYASGSYAYIADGDSGLQVITIPLPLDSNYVDNADPEFSVTGMWGTALSTALPGVYGADFRYHAGNPTNTCHSNNKAVWNAKLTDGPGYYTVKIRYPACPLLATNAPFTINHNGESETILVDQRRNGGKWLNMGIYYFADDGTENITLSDNADSWVVADVVKFTPTSPPPPPDGIVDNFDPKFSLTGTWPTSNTNKAPDFFGIDFRYHAAGDGTETVRWDTELINGPGLYDVSVWYPISAKLATNAPFTINHNGESDTVLINQGVKGGRWVSLGSYEFTDDGTENITLSDNADSWVVADAVRLSLIPHIDLVDPSSGSANSDTDITISGYNFAPDAKVSLGGGPYITGSVDTSDYAKDVYISGNHAYVAEGGSGLQIIMIPIELDINVVDSTTITATVPANLPSGVYDIIVINPGEGRDILPNGFEVF